MFVSAAASLGWVDRELALRRHQDPPGGGSSEHSTTEIRSNQYRKWVMMDPTAKMYLEKDGVPLNAWEIRQEWFHREGRDLAFVVGKERKRYRKSDLPIFLGRFAGFGDLTVPVDELNKYGFIGYIPNTDLMDAGLDYGNMFIAEGPSSAKEPGGMCEPRRPKSVGGPVLPDQSGRGSRSSTRPGQASGAASDPRRRISGRTKPGWTAARGVQPGETYAWSLKPGVNRSSFEP